jgi:hypothetical protein
VIRTSQLKRRTGATPIPLAQSRFDKPVLPKQVVDRGFDPVTVEQSITLDRLREIRPTEMHAERSDG